MSYLAVHKKNIRKSTPIQILDLRIGMIVEMQYKSLSKNQIDNSIYIILNEDFKDHVHVLDLENVPEQTLYELLKHSNDKRPFAFEVKSGTYTKFSFNKTSNALYEAAIKPLVTVRVPGAYKTLLRTKKDGVGIQQIKLVDYKWDTKKIPSLPKVVDKVIADTQITKP